MLLTMWVVLSVAGLAAFLLGHLLGFHGVATIGAVVVMLSGAQVAGGGIQTVDGKTVTTESFEREVADDDISGSNLLQTKDVSAQEGAPNAIDWGSDGDSMLITGGGSAAVHQYTGGEWDLSLATYERSLDVSTEDGTPTAAEYEAGDTSLYVPGDDTDSIYQYSLSTPANLSTATLERSLDVSAETTDPRGLDFAPDGETMFLVGAGVGNIEVYRLSEPWNISTATHQDVFDVSSQDADPTGIAFGADGDRMLLSGEGTDAVYQYNLGSSYDLTTAMYTGNSLDVSSEGGRPSSVAYTDDGRVIFTTDRNNGEAYQYDAATTEVFEETTEELSYTNHSWTEEFASENAVGIGVFQLLIGVLLFYQQMLAIGEGQ